MLDFPKLTVFLDEEYISLEYSNKKFVRTNPHSFKLNEITSNPSLLELGINNLPANCIVNIILSYEEEIWSVIQMPKLSIIDRHHFKALKVKLKKRQRESSWYNLVYLGRASNTKIDFFVELSFFKTDWIRLLVKAFSKAGFKKINLFSAHHLLQQLHIKNKRKLNDEYSLLIFYTANQKLKLILLQKQWFLCQQTISGSDYKDLINTVERMLLYTKLDKVEKSKFAVRLINFFDQSLTAQIREIIEKTGYSIYSISGFRDYLTDHLSIKSLPSCQDDNVSSQVKTWNKLLQNYKFAKSYLLLDKANKFISLINVNRILSFGIFALLTLTGVNLITETYSHYQTKQKIANTTSVYQNAVEDNKYEDNISLLTDGKFMQDVHLIVKQWQEMSRKKTMQNFLLDLNAIMANFPQLELESIEFNNRLLPRGKNFIAKLKFNFVSNNLEFVDLYQNIKEFKGKLSEKFGLIKSNQMPIQNFSKGQKIIINIEIEGNQKQ